MESLATLTDDDRCKIFDLSKPLPAERLFGQQAQVQIAYKGQIYTLRQTRNDKLILTK
jgi:hemin uptake protein HemP